MKCDKCEKEVSLTNDAVALESIQQRGELPNGLIRLAHGSRHLLPVGNCEGSPSRAQFLEGGTPDPRGYWANLTPEETVEWREKYRAAYQKLQELASA